MSALLPYLNSPTTSGFSLEQQLLLGCARTQVDDAIAKAIRHLVQQPINWHHLIDLAVEQQVAALLYRTLQNVCAEAIAAPILKQLRENYYTNIAESMALSHTLLQLLAQFATQNIPVIPYKGPVLAAAVYGNIALRQFFDLDLWVAVHDMNRAEALLITQGYQLTKQQTWEWTFVHTKTEVSIDLHQGMAQPFFPFRLSFESSTPLLQSVPLLGNMVRSLAKEDLLLVLSVQIVKDCYCQQAILIKVCDIAELVMGQPPLQWELVLVRATQVGCQRLLLLGLWLAHQLLGTPLPEQIWAHLGQDWVVRQYGQLLCRDFFDQAFPLAMFFVLKGLMLIEYPLHSPHNAFLAKYILNYPYKKLMQPSNLGSSRT